MTDSKLVGGSERPLCYFCFIGTGASFRMSLLDRNLPYLTCAQFGLEKIGKGIFFLFPVGIIWKMGTPFHSLIVLVIR